MFINFNKTWKPVYDDESGTATITQEQKDTIISEANDGKIILTQDEMNTKMAENRRTLTKQNESLVTQLETLKNESTRSTESRDELQLQIDNLQEQYMSKDELAKKANDKAGKEHQKLVEGLTQDRDTWQGMYANATIERSLLDAASEGEDGAIRPSQVVAMLRQNTHLVEVTDEAGQKTGTYVPVVTFSDIDDEGKATVSKLSPIDTIKRMKEQVKLYGNLFKGTATGGVGSTGGAGGTGSEGGMTPKLQELMDDPVKYAAWRKENPDLDYSKLK